MASNMAPQTSQKSVIELNMDNSNDVHLPCNIQGNPLPVFTWVSPPRKFFSSPSLISLFFKIVSRVRLGRPLSTPIRATHYPRPNDPLHPQRWRQRRRTMDLQSIQSIWRTKTRNTINSQQLSLRTHQSTSSNC